MCSVTTTPFRTTNSAVACGARTHTSSSVNHAAAHKRKSPRIASGEKILSTPNPDATVVGKTGDRDTAPDEQVQRRDARR